MVSSNVQRAFRSQFQCRLCHTHSPSCCARAAPALLQVLLEVASVQRWSSSLAPQVLCSCWCCKSIKLLQLLCQYLYATKPDPLALVHTVRSLPVMYKSRQRSQGRRAVTALSRCRRCPTAMTSFRLQFLLPPPPLSLHTSSQNLPMFLLLLLQPANQSLSNVQQKSLRRCQRASIRTSEALLLSSVQ